MRSFPFSSSINIYIFIVIYDTIKWYIEDSLGWYPVSKWQKIDGCWYYFEASGYMAVKRYIDGYWVGSDGVCN